MKENIIYVTSVDLLNAINDITKKHLFVRGNLFSLDHIISVWEMMNLTDCAEFSFSYNDSCTNGVFTIRVEKTSSLCIDFLKESKIINDSQISSIEEVIDSQDILNDFNKIDEIAINEAIVFLLDGVNKVDYEMIRNDFTSKFEKWKNTITSQNEQKINLLNEFYHKVIEAKLDR